MTELAQLRDALAATAPVGSSSHVDETTGTVVLRVAGKRTSGMDAAIGNCSRHVRIEENGGGAILANQVHDGTDLVIGGTPIDTALLERRCSSGFLVRGEGYRWLMSVAHCTTSPPNTPTEYWYTAGGVNGSGLIGLGTPSGIVSGLLETNVCVREGDSGGPLYARDTRPVYSNGQLKWHTDAHGTVVGTSTLACTDPLYQSWWPGCSR